METTIKAALASIHFENFDRSYGITAVIATALRGLPVEQRMEAMGMKRSWFNQGFNADKELCGFWYWTEPDA